MLRKVVVLISLLGMLFGASGALARTIDRRGFVFDDFNQIEIKPPDDTDHDPYWWVFQYGDVGLGGQYYDWCSDSACTSLEREGHTKFARLTFSPDATPGNYAGSELAEMRNRYSYGLPARWLPTPGHPVIATSRVRFSPTYHADGSGGAHGSAGLWLWNSYLGYTPADDHPITALGFGWGEIGSGGGYFSGLKTMTFIENTPVQVQPIDPHVDMSRWMIWTIIWTERAGVQSVTYLLNGKRISQADLPQPLPALSLEVWNDNQYLVGWDPATGLAIVDYRNPTAPQNLDIDFVAIAQP